jgi:HPt (histidine-containing phosphotransfer) domain-containing protein
MADIAGINNGAVYIDIDEGLKRVMDNKKLYAKLLAKFKNETTLDDIINALAQGRLEDARIAAHTLKGVSANLSLKQLFLKVQELEARIKEGKADPGLVDTVKAVFSATLTDIEKVTAHYGA